MGLFTKYYRSQFMGSIVAEHAAASVVCESILCNLSVK